jgi:hypothetical protein
MPALRNQALVMTRVLLALLARLAACVQTPSPSSGSTRSGRRAFLVGGWLAGRRGQRWQGWHLPASWASVGEYEPLVQALVRQALTFSYLCCGPLLQ